MQQCNWRTLHSSDRIIIPLHLLSSCIHSTAAKNDGAFYSKVFTPHQPTQILTEDKVYYGTLFLQTSPTHEIICGTCISRPLTEPELKLISGLKDESKPSTNASCFVFSTNPCLAIRPFVTIGKAESVTVRLDSSKTCPRIILAGLIGRVVRVGCTVEDLILPGGKVEIVDVMVSTGSAKDVLVSSSTDILFASAPSPTETKNTVNDTPLDRNFIPSSLDELPFLDNVGASLIDTVLLPLSYRNSLKKLNLPPLNGILLSGPPGVGKTWSVKQLARLCDAELIVVNGSDVFGDGRLSPAECLDLARKQMTRHLTTHPSQPCIFFIDELDAIASQRNTGPAGSGSKDYGALAKLLSIIDEAASFAPLVTVIAATNRPHSLDPSIRRAGRFDREVMIDPPTQKQRYKFIAQLIRECSLTCSDEDLVWVSSTTNGFVNADLVALVRHVVLNLNSQPTNGIHLVERSAFTSAMTKITPSLARSVSIAIEPVRWEDIGGLEHVKQKIRQAIEWPLLYPDTFRRLGLSPPRGILLYGPPGCSKTTFAKVIATCTSSSFLSISGAAAIYSSFVGEAEKTIRDLFQRARAMAPSVIFLDEIDALVGKRALGDGNHMSDSVQERILSTLLNEMDGIQSSGSVLVLAATNRPDRIDAALLRPGRFDHMIHIPAPDQKAREHILNIQLKHMPHSLTPQDVKVLAEATDLFTGADLKGVCREAALLALRDSSKLVNFEHFKVAIEKAMPTLTRNMLQEYLEYEARFGST